MNTTDETFSEGGGRQLYGVTKQGEALTGVRGKSRVMWTLRLLALGSLEEEDDKFEASLGYSQTISRKEQRAKV